MFYKTLFFCSFTLLLLNIPLIAQNPIIHDQFCADPTAKVFDGKVYLYASHDIEAPDDFPRKDWFCMHDYHIFSSENLLKWTDHGVIFSQDDVPWVKRRSYSMWAPDCVYANGKYYFFFPAVSKEAEKDEKFGVGVALGDHPGGPFCPLQSYIDGVTGIDPCVFIDDDGTPYIYWAEKGLHVAKMKQNLLELDGVGQLLTEGLPEGYKEGPFMFKRDGLYYLTYPWQEDNLEVLAYSIGKSPTGPFQFKGKIMEASPIKCWTNHHSVVEYQNQWYLFYHHNDYSPKKDKNRSVRIDSLTFNADGTIQPVTPTLRGVGKSDARCELHLDRYSQLNGQGASIDFIDKSHPFAGWFVRLSLVLDIVNYNAVEFKASRYQKLVVRYRSHEYSRLRLMLTRENTVVDVNFQLPKQEQWTTITLPFKKKVNGIYDLSLQLINGSIDIDWVKFE